MMIAVLLGSILSLTTTLLPNPFTKNEWKSTGNAFDNPKQEQFIFTPKNNDEDHWGSFISFTDSTFNAYYSAPCGLDCFVTTLGTYTIMRNHKIQVNVEHRYHTRICEETGDLGPFTEIYKFEFHAEKLLLTRD